MNKTKFGENKKYLLFFSIFLLLLALVIYRISAIHEAIQNGQGLAPNLGNCNRTLQPHELHSKTYPFTALLEQINPAEQIKEVIFPREMMLHACDLQALHKPFSIRPISELAGCLPDQRGALTGPVGLVLPRDPYLFPFGNPKRIAHFAESHASKTNPKFHLPPIQSDISDKWGLDKGLQTFVVAGVSGAPSCFQEGVVSFSDYQLSKSFQRGEDGVLRMNSNGEVALSYHFKQGRYRLEIESFGTIAENEYAKFAVHIVNSNTARQIYGNVFISPKVFGVDSLHFDASTEGDYRITVSFINDLTSNGQDRNFKLKKISLFSLSNPRQDPNLFVDWLEQIPQYKWDALLIFAFLVVQDLLLSPFIQFMFEKKSFQRLKDFS